MSRGISLMYQLSGGTSIGKTCYSCRFYEVARDKNNVVKPDRGRCWKHPDGGKDWKLSHSACKYHEEYSKDVKRISDTGQCEGQMRIEEFL